MLLFMTGLQNISQEIEEAASIDGANTFQNFFYITLPLLASTIRTSVYISVLGSIQQFIMVWIMTKGGPVNASETMATYMYRFGFVRFQLGYGSAVAIYMFLICLIFSLFYQRLTRQADYLTGLAIKDDFMTIAHSHRRWNSRKFAQRFLQYLILSIVVVIVFIPIVMLVFGALKTRGELLSHPYSLPIPPRWENITSILVQPSYSFWPMLRNSLFVMVSVTVGVVVICSLAAFVFARMEFRAKTVTFNLFTLGLMFPISIAILPVYFVLRQMDMIDNIWGVIIVQIAFQLSGNILILRGFFSAIPTELAGCGIY